MKAQVSSSRIECKLSHPNHHAATNNSFKGKSELTASNDQHLRHKEKREAFVIYFFYISICSVIKKEERKRDAEQNNSHSSFSFSLCWFCKPIKIKLFSIVGAQQQSLLHCFKPCNCIIQLQLCELRMEHQQQQ